MPEKSSYTEGTPNWVDLSTGDTEKAKAFYSGLFGWSAEDDVADGQVVYATFRKGEHPVAGLFHQPPEQAQMGVPFMWQTYIAVDDVDASTAKVEGAGGNVIGPPMDVMEAGRMSIVADPTGAVVMLWQGKAHKGAYVVNEPGALSWNELITPDVPAATDFLGKVVGITAHEQDMGGGFTYTLLKVGDADVGGAMNPPMEGIPPMWGVYFAVEDVDASVAKVQELGGSVANGPMDSPAGRMAVVADDQGAHFTVIQLEGQ